MATASPLKMGGTKPFHSQYSPGKRKDSPEKGDIKPFKSQFPSSSGKDSVVEKEGTKPFKSQFSSSSGISSTDSQWQQQDAVADKMSNNSEDSGIVDWNDPKSIKEKNRQILEGQMSCDVMFFVGGKREKLGAHKYILMSRSDVFRHMFNGSDVTKSEYDIPDISADCFWEVLKHIYCDDQKLQVLNVVGVLFAADRYDLLSLRHSCLDFLHVCLEIDNVCYLMMEVNKYGYHKEEKELLTFIHENAESVLETPGVSLLSRDLLNQIIAHPDLQLPSEVKTAVLEKWAKSHSQDTSQNPSVDNLMDSLQDCLYVYREDSSHRYVMDSITTRNVMDKFEEPVETPIVEPKASIENDETDSMSTVTGSSRSKSSVHTTSLLPSYNMWADLDQVTRLQEVHGSANNDAKKADAISFYTDRSIYLYGFSVYGPKKEGEGKYKVDTILTRKKKDIIMESIQIKGAGVILPVMFERPVKVDSKVMYTLEVYITGPPSHMGSTGQTKIHHDQVLFTFTNAKIKKNRSNVEGGQIPRLYFLPRNK